MRSAGAFACKSLRKRSVLVQPCSTMMLSQRPSFDKVTFGGGGRFAPPQVVVWALSCLIPILALVICGAVVWRSTRKLMFRLCWMVFTLMAMLIQLGIILFVLRAIIVTRIAYLQ